MKKTNYLPRLIVLMLTIFLVFTSLAACKQKPAGSSSLSSELNSAETSTASEEALSSEEPVESQENSTVSSNSAPTPSSTPTVNTPSSTPAPAAPVTSTPAPVVSSEPEPEEPAKKTPQELIIGKWEGYYDVGPEFVELGYNVEGDTKIKAQMEYTAAGTVIASIDMVTFKSIMRPILQQSMEEARNEAILENNMTPEEYDTAFLQEYGMTMSEYIEEVLITFDDVLNVVSEYKFAGDVLLVKDPYTEQFVESQYRFADDNTLIEIESGIETTYTRVS